MTALLPTPSPSDRRRDLRVLHEVAVTLTSDHNFYAGFTVDVSAGGLFVATEEPLPIGTLVSFELTLGPQVVKVPVEGVVRWVRDSYVATDEAPAGVGIQFVDLDGRLRNKIEAFLERRDAMFYEPPDEP